MPWKLQFTFVLKNPAVSSAVIGIRTESQLKEALAIRGARTATAEDQMDDCGEIFYPQINISIIGDYLFSRLN